MPDGLLGLATALVAIPSVSHHERPWPTPSRPRCELCPWLRWSGWATTWWPAPSWVGTAAGAGRPPRHRAAGRRQRGAPGRGRRPLRLGAADMKGGLAVFLHLAGDRPRAGGGRHLVLLRGEEVAREFNGLRQLWTERPDLLAADAAILGEPTGGLVEAGCQGTLRIRDHAGGAAGPHRPPLRRSQRHPPAGPDPDRRRRLRRPAAGDRRLRVRRAAAGRRRREGAWPATWCPIEASVLINHRFAPDRTAERGRGGRPGAAGPVPRGRATAGSWSRRRRRPPAARPSRAGRAGRGHRGAAPGQGGLDRRGLVLGPRGPGRQLRAGRPAAGPHRRASTSSDELDALRRARALPRLIERRPSLRHGRRVPAASGPAGRVGP